MDEMKWAVIDDLWRLDTRLATRMAQQQRETREKEIRTDRLLRQLQQQQKQQQPGQPLPKPMREAQQHTQQTPQPQPQPQQQQQQQTNSPRRMSWLPYDTSSSSPKDVSRQPTPTKSPTITSLETERLAKSLTSLRLDLSASQRSREELERKVGSLRAEIIKLRQERAGYEKKISALTVDRAQVHMKLRDMDEEIKGKDELRNVSFSPAMENLKSVCMLADTMRRGDCRTSKMKLHL